MTIFWRYWIKQNITKSYHIFRFAFLKNETTRKFEMIYVAPMRFPLFTADLENFGDQDLGP